MLRFASRLHSACQPRLRSISYLVPQAAQRCTLTYFRRIRDLRLPEWFSCQRMLAQS